MAITPPSLVSDYEVASWASGGASKTASVTTVNGDLLVTAIIAADVATWTPPMASGGGLTWGERVTVTNSSECDGAIYTAPSTSDQTFTETVALTTAGYWGFDTVRFSGHGGYGATVAHNKVADDPTASIVTTSDNSGVLVIIGDWAAINEASPVWINVNGQTTQQLAFRQGDTSTYAAYVGWYPDVGAAGSKTIGLTTPALYTAASLIAIEIKGVNAGTASASRSTTWNVASLDVQYVGAGTFQGGTNTITPTIPAGATTGDLLILAVETANEAVTTPGGWTPVPGGQIGTGTAAAIGAVAMATFYKWYAAGDPTVADSGNHTTGRIVAFRGVDPTTPFISNAAARVDASGTTTFTSSSVTVPTHGMQLVCVGLDRDAATTDTELNAVANATLIGSNTVTSGTGGGVGLLYSTTTGALTQTSGFDTSLAHAYVSISLQPKAYAVGTSRGLIWNVQGGTPVSTTRDVSWKVAALVPATSRATTWETRAVLAQITRDVSWTVRTPVTPTTRDLLWKVAEGILATRDVAWNVAATVAPTTRDLLWVVLAQVAPTTRDVSWETRATAPPATRDTTWAVAAYLSVDRVLLWNTDQLGAVGTTRSTTWAVAEQIPADRILVWAVLTPVAEVTRAASWVTYEGIPADRVLLWSVEGALTSLGTTRDMSWSVWVQVPAASRETLWETRAEVTPSTRTLSWTTLAQVSPTTRTLSWVTFVYTGDSRNLLWDVLSTITDAWPGIAYPGVTYPGVGTFEVAFSRGVIWETRAATSPATRVVSWSVAEKIPANRVLSWNVWTQVPASARTLLWATAAYQGTTRDLLWTSRTPVPAASREAIWNSLERQGFQRDLLWNVSAYLRVDRVLLWATLGDLNSVLVTRDLVWSQIGRVLADRVLLWEVHAVVPTSTRTLSWRTLESILAPRDVAWEVRTPVLAPREMVWGTYSLTRADRALVWAVAGSVLASRHLIWQTLFGLFVPNLCRYLRIDYEDRTLVIPYESRDLYIPAESRELVIPCA